MGGLRGQEWIVILIIVLLLFGASRLPLLARSFGKSARILREEMKGEGPAEKGDGTVQDTDDDGDKPRG